MVRPEYVADARQTDPEGATCGFCGKENNFADDCGWFYLSPDLRIKESRPACEACYDGKPGQRHRAHYGVGER